MKIKNNIVVTSLERDKFTWADSQLKQMKLANALGGYTTSKRLTKVVWNFATEEDAVWAANYFINRIGFEYVHRI